MTAIVEMTKGGVSIAAWLCDSHRAARKADGWSGKVTGTVTDHPCDDCIRDQRAPATVDFVSTSPTSRRPTQQECPPPPPMAPWAKPKVKPAAKQAKEAA